MKEITSQVQTMLSFQQKKHKEILNVVKPLFDFFHISFFAHERVFNDGSKAIITSNASITKFWFDEQYPLDIVVDTGCYLGDKLGNIYPAEQQAALKQHFDLNHTLFIIDRQPAYSDAFMLSTSVTNEQITNFYITYLDKIKGLLACYLQNGQALINQAEQCKINLIRMPPLETIIKPFSDELAGSYYIDHKIGLISLTRRELTCISWLIKGKSANEIGLLLNISKRTVETYIENIKRKFKCHKITELAYLIGKYSIELNT